jgi:double-stranded uracil-DNA glycosylase
MDPSYKPTPQELLAAHSTTLPDTIRNGLKVLWVGINPGLYTAATQWHYGRPGNRFWRVLHEAGFTPRLFHPSESKAMLELGYGLTNLVARATNAESELSKAELITGGEILRAKLREFKPKWVVFVGLGAYRKAFGDPKAQVGRQPTDLEETKVWLLPSPSGLNAHFPPKKLTEEFKKLRDTIEN